MWYAKARYYNPDLGRFAAEDPIKGNILDIQSLNLYSYVKNNLLKYVDPDGRKPETIEAEAEDWTGCGPTLMEAAELAEHVYFEYSVEKAKEDILLGGWKLEDVYEPGSLRIGVYARTNINGATEFVLVNRGSQDWSWEGDLDDNLKQPFGASEDMQNSIAYAQKFVRNNPNANITFVGHSKGGAEAAANAVATNRNAILFNPATVHLKAYGLDSSEYTAEMTAYIVEGEILNIIFGPISKPIDEVEYLPTQHPVNTLNPKTNIDNAIENHKMPAVKDAIREKGWEKRR